MRALRWSAIFLIRGYQAIVRPHLVGSCPFCPTCSEYAALAVGEHGLLRGALLAARRLARCHPWSKGGIDPVPRASR
ncbi:MAG: membrane protein insertion efficiency factor YidD [Planctomycetota bacterium]